MRPYIHHIQGRLGIRCPLVKGSKSCADKVQKMLRSQPGICECEVNTVTGSVLVRYDNAGTSADSIIKRLQTAGYLNAANEVSRIKQPLRRWELKTEEAKKTTINAVAKAVFGELVERSAVALITAVL